MNAKINLPTKTLVLLTQGQKAKIKKLHAKGKLLQKLLDMGFVNSVEIEVIREAPLFDPMQLKLHNYHLSVRKSEARLIEIEQHIANYPGVTVDKKTGFFTYDNHRIEMVDLPGTYSFSSYSLEERVAKDFIIDEDPDVIVNVVDASNIKRNLYLTFQLLEIGIPVVVVLNMMDVATRRGTKIDSKKISQMLNCPVVEASGAKGISGEQIMKSIVNTSKNIDKYEEFKINYDVLEPHIKNIENKIDTTKL